MRVGYRQCNGSDEAVGVAGRPTRPYVRDALETLELKREGRCGVVPPFFFTTRKRDNGDEENIRPNLVDKIVTSAVRDVFRRREVSSFGCRAAAHGRRRTAHGLRTPITEAFTVNGLKSKARVRSRIDRRRILVLVSSRDSVEVTVSTFRFPWAVVRVLWTGSSRNFVYQPGAEIILFLIKFQPSDEACGRTRN